jgi:soluble lytic murein transglycosylase
MARVPLSQGPTVADQPLPGAYQRSSASPDLLGAAGRQDQQLGAAAVGVGTEVQHIQNQLVDQANAARVDDAVNKASEIAMRLQHDPKEGFKSLTGYDALERPQGLPLADEYSQKLQKSVDEIGAGLGNDRQRQMFGMKANNIVTGFRGHAMIHAGQQLKDYTLSVKEATVSNAQNALTLNFTDPGNVQTQVTRIRAAIEGGQDENGVFIPGAAQMQGKSAAWAKEKSAEAISAAHGGAVKSALEQGNVNLAKAYFDHYSKQMTAKDVLAVQGTLQRDYDTRQGMTIGNEVFEEVKPKIVPSDFGRLTSLVVGAESGGRRFGVDGKLLTSAKGAQGEMQVMPATAKAPGYGVKPAADGSPDELARVGRDYLAAMVKEFKGDVPKALAAYNAGPGAVDDAVKAGGADWLAKLPKETQAYVAGITSKFGTGGGAPEKPTLAELHEDVERRLGAGASPMAIKTAKDQVTQRFTDQEKAVKQRADETKARAMQLLVQNGGKYGELPASIRNALATNAPGEIDNVMNFGARVAKGDDTTNPAVYLRLSNAAVIGKMTEAELYGLRGELSESDFKHFSNERNRIMTGTTTNGPGELNTAAIRNTLDQRLRELKIDPSPKDDGGDDAARVGSIRRFVDTQLLALQRDAGKKFNDAETVKAIDQLITNKAELKGFFSTYNAPAISAKPGDIPSGTRDRIKQSFKAAGVDEPTDAQVLGAFLHLNAAGKK